MRFPIQITKPDRSSNNWHGPDHTTLRSTVRIWRLDSSVPAWRPSLYLRSGAWWSFDVYFRGFH